MAVVRVASVACPVCVVVSLLLLVFLIMKKIKDYYLHYFAKDLFCILLRCFALPYFVGFVLRLFLC